MALKSLHQLVFHLFRKCCLFIAKKKKWFKLLDYFWRRCAPLPAPSTVKSGQIQIDRIMATNYETSMRLQSNHQICHRIVIAIQANSFLACYKSTDKPDWFEPTLVPEGTNNRQQQRQQQRNHYYANHVVTCQCIIKLQIYCIWFRANLVSFTHYNRCLNHKQNQIQIDML